MNWSTSRISPKVHRIAVNLAHTEFPFRVLLTGDRHWDNPKSRRDMQKRHLDQALAIDAPVIDVGDLFCAMESKHDRRASKSVRDEHNYIDYTDRLVNDAIEWFKPYASQIAILGMGNHETAILSHNNTNLTNRLAAGLGENTFAAGYHGWVQFKFVISDSERHSANLYFHHGAGGGGPVTKGIIDSHRMLEWLDNVDVIASGHVHQEMVVNVARESINSLGRIKRKEVIFVRVPTYKDEWSDQAGGFAVERRHGPRPLGAMWLEFWIDHTDRQVRCRAASAM